MYFIRDYDSPKPYQIGIDPDVMVLGQDPTIDQSTRFAMALGLGSSESSPGRESPPLKNYVFNKILAPLGVSEPRIIATNLVNLYYHDVPNRKIAKQYRQLIVATAKNSGIAAEQYPDHDNGAILHALNFEAKTRKDFENLLNSTAIVHLITLGEPVYQVLRERYGLDLPAKIKDVLKALVDRPPVVLIGDKVVSLLPLPHIFNEKNRKWDFYKKFLSEGLPRLAAFYNSKQI